LDEALKVGEWLLRVDEERKRLDVFAVRVLVNCG
jgi:hypothetical protein